MKERKEEEEPLYHHHQNRCKTWEDKNDVLLWIFFKKTFSELMKLIHGCGQGFNGSMEEGETIFAGVCLDV